MLTSSGEVTDRPDDYVLNPGRSKVWRSPTDTNDHWLLFDLGSAKNFQVVELPNSATFADLSSW